MSFVDLATLTIHRRNELEGRLNVFYEKCDRAIEDIKKLKTKTQGFVHQLNCEPADLKECFLHCMKQLDEYTYLITDFNLAIGKIEESEGVEYTPVHDTSMKLLLPTPAIQPFNLLDALSEPTPSTSAACSKHCAPEKPKRVKVPKNEQTLILFSSTSSSEETVPQSRSEMVTKEVQCEVVEDMKNVKLDDSTSEECNLPAQVVLETEQAYEATIMHVDGAWIWLMTDDPHEVASMMLEMTQFYRNNHELITLDEVKTLTCCAFYDDDSDCYYRGLFLKINEKDNVTAAIFAVDTGEIRPVGIDCIQPLYPQYCNKPPYARCCHLAGVDLLKNLMDKQEALMRSYVGTQCTIEVDDNTSESLGVYVVLPSGETLNEIMVKKGLAHEIDKPSDACTQTNEVVVGPPSDSHSELGMDDCPEYEDPVEAVTGYHNRDEADICKHYKGGPEKTCFKGSRCTKKHIVKHPEGWTLDQVEVMAKFKPAPLPAPDTWHKVLVTYVCHYDRIYVQFLKEKEKGNGAWNQSQVTLDGWRDYGEGPNGTRVSLLGTNPKKPDLRPLGDRVLFEGFLLNSKNKMAPAPGEMVAAMYPLDSNWYRARVLSVTPSDQSVEVMYVDYGTVLWVKQDKVRHLEPRHVALEAQAVCCVLAGVRSRSHSSQHWAAAKRALADMVQDRTLDAHVIAREYDEVAVELFDQDGYSVAEQLAALGLVELREYSVVDDRNVPQKVVAP